MGSFGVVNLMDDPALTIVSGTAFPSSGMPIPPGTTRLRIRIVPAGASSVVLVEGAGAVETTLASDQDGYTWAAGKDGECTVLMSSERTPLKLKVTGTTSVNVLVQAIQEDI